MFATGFVVVNETVALPVAPATRDAGSTFVPVSAPGVIVSAVTDVFSSIVVLAAFLVRIV